jgi:hypothetical protein
MIRLNEMLIAPLISCFFLFLGEGDFLMIVSAATTAYRAWSEWIEFEDLRFQVQNMYLLTMAAGGPFISTNDTDYQAFVYADAVVRVREGLITRGTRHHCPVPVLP